MGQGNVDDRSVRVLHVIGTLDRGGIETWLMNVWRRADRHLFEHSVLVNNGAKGVFGDELRRLDISVYYAPHPADFIRYRQFMQRTLKDNGPFDIVHSHVYDLSGFVLKIAESAGVPVRVAHSHNTKLIRSGMNGLIRRWTWPLQRRWIRSNATSLAAVSDEAGRALFGEPKEQHARCWSILPLGIDLTRFQSSQHSDRFRSELGIPTDAFVVGHVGAFTMQKNHSFIVDVFYELCQRENNAWLLLVGDGPLAEEVLAKAEQLKLDERVILAGVRDDVPELMVHAMDVFLFPSRFEGLGLVLLEAQAAGLPCVVADTVPAEARLVDGLIHQVPLTASPSRWADSVLAARETGVGREQALATVSDSMYSIEGSVEALESFYLSTLARDDSVLRTANG